MVTTGEIVSHYRILERLGGGGMGVVYRAHDERLDRDVAVKVLREDSLVDEAARKRLQKEARALSKLNHPNIEMLFELNAEGPEEFLAVEYVAGTSLSDKLSQAQLPQKDIVRLGMQLADGLAAAHAQGVVHCDLKPSNLRITPDGRLKIVDFGIAKLKPIGKHPMADGTTWSSSGDPAVLGTLPYMAPEQLRSEAADGRTDIYASGVVLYEAATTRRPYQGATAPALIDDILHQPPVPPRSLNSRISPELERIILKCLRKEPENRYQSAQELEVDLRQLAEPKTAELVPVSGWTRPWRGRAGMAALIIVTLSALIIGLKLSGLWDRPRGGGSVERIESVAVLPLQNLSNNPEYDYFVDGMTDELTTTLAQIRPLRVISRTSAMRYKGTTRSIRDVARELNVDAVVEGSVLRSGDRVRISAQLIEAATDRHLWAESYERDVSDVLAIQSEVARAIVDEIQVNLSPQEVSRLHAPRAVKPEAYDAYLKGRFFWNKRDRESVMTGLKYFQQAIDLDPTYALAYTGVADSYLIIGINYWLSPREAFPKAKAAALSALDIDDTLAEAHTSMIWVKELDWDWMGAEIEAKRALDINPGYATAHQWYSGVLILMGQNEEAIAEARRAADLDPLSAIIALNSAQTYYYARRFTQARQGLQRIQDISPGFLSQYDFGAIDIVDGRTREGVRELQDAAAHLSGDDAVTATLGYAYALSGKESDAEALVKDLLRDSRRRYVSPCFIALVYAGLGMKEEAFKWLGDAYEQRDRLLPWYGIDPLFDPLRPDPRFQDLLRRMNLPRAGA